MRRDPSRGRTHFVLRQVMYVPEESDLRYRFTITHAGVFKLDDCWDAIDEVMGGEGKELVRDILNDVDSTSVTSGRNVAPMLDLTIGESLQPWLGSSKPICHVLCIWLADNTCGASGSDRRCSAPPAV